MRILLAGKNGQLGWELFQRLEQRHDVIAIGREDIDFQEGQHLHDMLKRLPPLALIVNCAAYTDVDKAEQQPLTAELVNAEAPAILAAEADRRNIPILHFSTDYVFDGQRKSVASRLSDSQSVRVFRWCIPNKRTEPYTEDERPNPPGVYGWSKLAGEQRVQDICEKHLIFRLSGLYGTRRRNFLTTMLRYLDQGETPCVVDDQIVSPNWCPMIAEAVVHVISQIGSVGQNEWGVYHLTGTGSTTWHEFACLIFEKAAKLWNKPLIVPQAVSSEEFGAAAKRPAYSIMNPEKFTKTFDCTLPDWQTQILQCINSI